MPPALAARLSRFLVGCYPWRWRQRYAGEMLEVLGQHRPTARTVLNLGAGAVSAHLDPAWRTHRPGLRRGARAAMAVAGLLVGFGVYVTSPHEYQASTSLLLTSQAAPGEASGAPILNERAMAESGAVAELALDKLGLRQSAGSFLGTYTVTAPTDRMLVITISAPSSSAAVTRANTLAVVFLQFRAGEVKAAQKLVAQTFQQQIDQATQRVSSLAAQIRQVSAEPTSATQQAELKNLQTQEERATGALTWIQQVSTQNEVSTTISSYNVVHDSEVLDPAGPLPPHSRLKRLIEYTFIGLIAGLVLGMGIVVVRAHFGPATSA
jgi:capsular polysaccharide biosynthesis protein